MTAQHWCTGLSATCTSMSVEHYESVAMRLAQAIVWLRTERCAPICMAMLLRCANMHERHACTDPYDGRWPSQRLQLDGPHQPWYPDGGAPERAGWPPPQRLWQEHHSRSLPAIGSGARDLRQRHGRNDMSRQHSAPVGAKRALGDREAGIGQTTLDERPPVRRALETDLRRDRRESPVRQPHVDIRLSLQEMRCLQALVQVRLNIACPSCDTF